jgi:Mrp family chromosome partitioning ATPase
MARVLPNLADAHDVVLVDTPPVLLRADATGLAFLVDGVVLAVRYGDIEGERLHGAATGLRQVGARPLGVVLNIVPRWADAAVGYSFAYRNRPVDREVPRTGS